MAVLLARALRGVGFSVPIGGVLAALTQRQAAIRDGAYSFRGGDARDEGDDGDPADEQREDDAGRPQGPGTCLQEQGAQQAPAQAGASQAIAVDPGPDVSYDKLHRCKDDEEAEEDTGDLSGSRRW